MRVIAGEFGGRRLRTPRGEATRPTSERVREAVFSMLGEIAGARVLDLFAGSGALGIEALSRGAASAVFVDSDRDAIRAVDRNLEKLRLTGARYEIDQALGEAAQEHLGANLAVKLDHALFELDSALGTDALSGEK